MHEMSLSDTVWLVANVCRLNPVLTRGKTIFAKIKYVSKSSFFLTLWCHFSTYANAPWMWGQMQLLLCYVSTILSATPFKTNYTAKCRFMNKRVLEMSRFFVAPQREFAPAVRARPRTPFSINTSTSVQWTAWISWLWIRWGNIFVRDKGGVCPWNNDRARQVSVMMNGFGLWNEEGDGGGG